MAKNPNEMQFHIVDDGSSPKDKETRISQTSMDVKSLLKDQSARSPSNSPPLNYKMIQNHHPNTTILVQNACGKYEML